MGFRWGFDGLQVGRYIPPAWLQQTEVVEWAGEVEKLWPDLISKDLHELEILFVEQCRDRPMYVMLGSMHGAHGVIEGGVEAHGARLVWSRRCSASTSSDRHK